MTNKPTCKKCGKNFKVLTKEGYCAICSLKVNGEWPAEFRGSDNKRRRY
ncbi:hypothetical protein KAI04_04290 [Candidatus Pacearchaeota archaeon]|nr:hypothetical protein [Candidatus Pacearchaeota archaeon]